MKIKFLPTNQEIELDPNKSLLQNCMDNGIFIKSLCKGVPSCAECRIKIVEGENNVLPPSKAELSLIGTSYYIDQRRLSCQLRCFGPMVIDISEHQDRNDSANKKIRGYKAPKGSAPTVSVAKQGTLVLESGDKGQNKP
jgi:2Fe-2S ferredoxin